MEYYTRYFLCKEGPLFDRCKAFAQDITDANAVAVEWAKDKGFHEPLYCHFGTDGYRATGIACGPKNKISDELKGQMTQPRKVKGSYRTVFNPKKSTKVGKEFAALPAVSDFQKYAKDLIDPPTRIDWKNGSEYIRLFGSGLGVAFFDKNEGPFLIYLPDHHRHWKHIQIERDAKHPIGDSYNWTPDRKLRLKPIQKHDWDLLVAKNKVALAKKNEAAA